MRIYGIVSKAGCLTQRSVDRQHNILADEAEHAMRVLSAENKRGELTKAGARELATKLDTYAQNHASRLGPDTGVSYRASNNRIQATRVRSQRHPKIDADKMAIAVLLMARQMAGDKSLPSDISKVEDARVIKQYEALLSSYDIPSPCQPNE